jgi:hypothetical protein
MAMAAPLLDTDSVQIYTTDCVGGSPMRCSSTTMRHSVIPSHLLTLGFTDVVLPRVARKDSINGSGVERECGGKGSSDPLPFFPWSDRGTVGDATVAFPPAFFACGTVSRLSWRQPYPTIMESSGALIVVSNRLMRHLICSTTVTLGSNQTSIALPLSVSNWGGGGEGLVMRATEKEVDDSRGRW